MIGWGSGLWGIGTWGGISYPAGMFDRVVFPARGRRHHGRPRGASVMLDRPRQTTTTLPQRMNVSPIPQGSNGIMGDEPSYYGDGCYGEVWFSE